MPETSLLWQQNHKHDESSNVWFLLMLCSLRLFSQSLFFILYFSSYKLPFSVPLFNVSQNLTFRIYIMLNFSSPFIHQTLSQATVLLQISQLSTVLFLLIGLKQRQHLAKTRYIAIDNWHYSLCWFIFNEHWTLHLLRPNQISSLSKFC